MLTLYLEAPFAACRSFTAGWYRPTATFLTPSAAYGLLLNLAAVETRLREEEDRHPQSVPATLTRTNLPPVRIALGAVEPRFSCRSEQEGDPDPFPRVATLYQQLHNYPVGDAKPKGAEEKPSAAGMRRARGNKYNISPVRREILVGLRALVVVDGNADLEDRVRRGLAGELSAGRYGLPFLGDNSFLPDRIDPLASPPSAYWYERVTADARKIRPRTTRLTVWIDRAEMSRTRSELFAPTINPSRDIPALAWTEIQPPPE
jgi:CRISPR-associated protein Cas5t